MLACATNAPSGALAATMLSISAVAVAVADPNEALAVAKVIGPNTSTLS